MQNIIITLCGQCGNTFAKICSCPQVIEQNTTNQHNEEIVNTICGALTEIAIIAALLIIILHIIKHIANCCKEKRENCVKQDEKSTDLKNEYRTKIHEYLKEETSSYSKLLKELDKKKKKNEEKFKEVNDAIENVKQELVENRFIGTSTCSQIIDQLYSIKEKMNDLEIADTTEKTDWNNWNKFHDSLKQSEYLKALTYFLEGDDKEKGEKLFNYLTGQLG